MTDQKHPPYRYLVTAVSLRCMDAIRYCGAIDDRDGKSDWHVDQIERALKECLEAVATYRDSIRQASEAAQ